MRRDYSPSISSTMLRNFFSEASSFPFLHFTPSVSTSPSSLRTWILLVPWISNIASGFRFSGRKTDRGSGSARSPAHRNSANDPTSPGGPAMTRYVVPTSSILRMPRPSRSSSIGSPSSALVPSTTPPGLLRGTMSALPCRIGLRNPMRSPPAGVAAKPSMLRPLRPPALAWLLPLVCNPSVEGRPKDPQGGAYRACLPL